MRRAAVTVGALALALAGCPKKESAPPPQPQPAYGGGYGYGYGGGYGAPPPGAPAPGSVPAPAPGPAPGGSPSPAPAAFGFPCASDGDLQCPFAHCVSGRCGGCASNADCKPGSQCAWSPWGMACSWPSPYGAPAPAPTPTAAPSPTASPPTPSSPAPPVASSSSDAFARAREICLAHTNELRARVGARPLSYASQSNGCSDGAAASDGRTRTAHGGFGGCRETAQNECPGWPAPAEQMTAPCLDMMFGEGPGDFSGHGHYLNMTNRAYTQVACGFAVAPDGKIWMVQNFF